MFRQFNKIRGMKISGIFTYRSKFLLKFLAAASLLFIVFYYGEQSYKFVIREAVSEYYYMFKDIFALQVPKHLYTDLLLIQSLSLFALILVTPKIPFNRKMKFLLAGIGIFFALDLFFTILDLTFQSSETWILLAADFLKLALPLCLWFAFSHKYILSFADERTAGK